jgi:hypothetical protein
MADKYLDLLRSNERLIKAQILLDSLRARDSRSNWTCVPRVTP